MQGMNGYELAEIVKQKYPNTKIQIISGFSDDKHHETGCDELSQQRLQKPVHLINIARCIRKLLDD